MKDHKRLIKLVIVFIMGLIIFVMMCFNRDVFNTKDTVTVFKGLCDAAFLPGAFLLCIGALIFCSNQGSFDGISYAFKAGLHGLIPLAKSPGKFGDYKQERHKTPSKFVEFLIAGGIYMLIAILFLIIYKSVE